MDPVQIPRPSRFDVIEGEQALVRQARKELNGKKGVAGRFFVKQLGKRGGAIAFAAKRICNKLIQIFKA